MRFNEGQDYVPDDDMHEEAEYEAVFADSTAEEAARHEERWISVTTPDGNEQYLGPHPRPSQDHDAETDHQSVVDVQLADCVDNHQRDWENHTAWCAS